MRPSGARDRAALMDRPRPEGGPIRNSRPTLTRCPGLLEMGIAWRIFLLWRIWVPGMAQILHGSPILRGNETGVTRESGGAGRKAEPGADRFVTCGTWEKSEMQDDVYYCRLTWCCPGQALTEALSLGHTVTASL
jgi:hypothetical protein